MPKYILEGTEDEIAKVKAPGGVRVSAIIEPNREIDEGGSKTMPDFCPTCQQKDFEKALAERDHKAELEKSSAEANQLRAQLTEAIANAQVQDIPNFPDIIAHCEGGTCPGHAKQLQDYRESVGLDVLRNLTKPESKGKLLEVMKQAGVDEAPSKITISGI